MIYAQLSAEEQERLHAAYEAGFAAAACRPARIPDRLRLLVAHVMDDWFRRMESAKAAYDAREAEREAPEWLQAEIERKAALGDGQSPPELHTAPLRGQR